MRHQQLISFAGSNNENEEEEIMKKITNGREPFDEIDPETMEVIKYDAKKELPIYSKFSIEDAQNTSQDTNVFFFFFFDFLY